MTPILQKNLLIKGDNLKVLQNLMPAYSGKIKCIYLDPPYNTHRDNKPYIDSFKPSNNDYIQFLKPRFEHCIQFLADDGFLFCSIGRNSLFQVGQCLDSIFGLNKRIAILTISSKTVNGLNIPRYVRDVAEYVVVYKKSKKSPPFKGYPYQIKENIWINPEYKNFLGTKTLKKHLPHEKFNYVKSIDLLKDIFNLCTSKNDIILDPFAGSGTTAEAIHELNQVLLSQYPFEYLVAIKAPLP